jgi:hypothetical protein
VGGRGAHERGVPRLLPDSASRSASAATVTDSAALIAIREIDVWNSVFPCVDALPEAGAPLTVIAAAALCAGIGGIRTVGLGARTCFQPLA